MTNSVDASGSQPKEQLKQQSKKAPEEAKAAEEAKAKEAESLEASSGSTKPETAPESTNESRAQAAAKREQNTSGSGQNKETLLTQTVRGYKPEAEPQTQATALLTHLKKQTSEDTTNDVYSDYNEGGSSESTQPANPALKLLQTKQSYRQESTQAQQAVRQLSNKQKQKIIDLSDALIRLGKPEEVTQALKDLFLQPQKAQEILSNLEETKNQADIEAFEVQAQNLRLNVTEEIKKLARESRDIIQARNILLQANSQTKYPSQEEKDLYLKATEAMLSGQEQLTDIILVNLMLGNIEEAQRAYQENLESLSPEQRLAKMQTLHTAKITENARTVETALEHEQEQFKKRMTSVRDTFQHMDNCLGQRSNQQHEIGFDPFRPSLMNNNSTGKRGLQDLLKAAQESTEDKPLDVYEFVNQSFRSADLKLQIETPSLSSALSQRAELKDIQLEATQLAQAGNIEMAAALLNGDISITDIETAKLQQSNPYAARLTAPDGSEVSDEDMITLEREQLEKLINQNRMAMAQLENQRNSLFSRLEENPLGEDKPAQLEHHALLSAQQKQLERQTQRLFQTHDRVTKLVNEGNYAGARDILEGRTSVLAERQEAENLQSAAQLADRHFTRTAAEEEKYQETQKVLKALQQEQEDQSHLENGTRRNLSQTYKDLRENSGWVARWGGLTEQLQKQRDLERGRLDQFERQREQVDRLKDTARSLIAQGKYDEATDLLAKTIDFSSESFQNANSAMIKSYQAINEEIEEFDQKFKDEALTVIKHVAIGTVAVGVTLALAPATGGLSLAAAGTMIGGGTLAGAGVGLFIDVVDDAVVDTKVFGDTLAEGFGYNEEDGYWGIAKEFGGKQYRNVQSAFTASLTFTGATSLSRPLIARGFSAYKSTGLSTLFTAPATSSVNLGFDKIAAEAEYLDMSEEQRAAYSSKAKFLESRGLSPASMFKRVTFDTGTEVLASLVGVKIDRFFSKIKGVQGQAREQAAAQLKNELLIDFTRNGVEGASDIAFGLIAEYMTNPEGITSQGLAQNIVQALVGRKIGDFTAQSFESRRSMPDLSGVRESHSLPDGVQAQTTVRYGNDGKPISQDSVARPELIARARSGDSDARAILREEAQGHLQEIPLDPLKNRDGTLRETPMSKDAYMALRAQRELAMQVKGKALQAQAENQNVSPTKQDTKPALTEMNQAIKDGDLNRALEIAEANGIGEIYREQYAKDYDHNVNPNRTRIEETNFHKSYSLASEALSNIKKTINDVNIGDITKNISSEDMALANLVLREMSQFGNMESLNNLVDSISSLKDSGYTLLTDNRGNIAGGLQYLHEKGSFTDKNGDSTLPNISRIEDIAQLNKNTLIEQGQNKLAIILDKATLERIALDDSFSNKLKELGEQGIDIKLVNPQGWNNGINPFTGRTDIASRLSSLTQEAKSRINTNPERNPSEIISQLINEDVVSILRERGLEPNLINITNDQARPRSNIIDTLQQNVQSTLPSEKALGEYINKLSPKEQEALLEVMKRDLQIYNSRSIGELAKYQYDKILELAQNKGINPNDIHFYLPGENETKSSQFSAIALQENTNINPDQFFSDYDKLPQGKNKMIVILDDNSLSGDSQLKVALNFRVRGFEGPMVSSTTVATTASEKALIDRNFGNQTARAEARAEKIVRKGLDPKGDNPEWRKRGLDLVYKKDPNLYELPAVRYQPLLETEYFKNLPIERQEQLKTALGHLGYGNSATAIALPWMSPNNNHSLIQGYSDNEGITRFFTLNQQGVKREYK